MENWDTRFFSLCELISSWSEDQSRKVGAVIVGAAHEIRSTGYNGLPRGISVDPPSRHLKGDGEKYFWFEHAERNAIYNAARAGISIDGCTLYCNLFPCAECLRAIIQSGIMHLKTYIAPESDPSYQRSFQVAQEMLAETKIEVSIYRRNL